jgi:hypothetical protein
MRSGNNLSAELQSVPLSDLAITTVWVEPSR